MSRKVFLWSASRSLSTAFTRAMMNVNDCEVFMEPYWYGHYSLWGDICAPSKGLTTIPPDQIQLSMNRTTDSVLAKSANKQFVFCKEIAKNVAHPPYFLKDEKLNGFWHTFLIRHPEKTIPSLYRVFSESDSYPDVDTIDFSYEGGFKQLYNIFEFVSNHFDTSPMVIFADDLLQDPEKVLNYYCSQTGLPYNKGMSCWKPGHIDGWLLPEFYVNVTESCGIGKQEESRTNYAPIGEKGIAKIRKAIEDNIWYYEQLYKYRVQF
ncbi:branched-chain-amino-acid aminotransferase-like protein 1 [Dendronephthya gigantea]|uniref:branched-chain-amino-acid aminotransferase-like protein 1 n=1 Tax=Dendronephthya gigantea TaxID=151771 RepID=UPI00106CBAF2|nr:branched-chain-amino-acid aminotransferase-like protein 1 [Dendronephthya gigantea]